MKNPPERDDYGWTQDNCGNWIAYIRPDVLDLMLNELTNGSIGIPLSILTDLEKTRPES